MHAPRGSTSTGSATASAQRAPHGRIALLAALIALVVASWSYLVYEDWAMRHMDVVDMAMPGAGAWSPADLALVFVMWAVMMVAMMVPAAAPAILIHRRLQAARSPFVPAASALFVAGYLLVWTSFSIVATAAQWGLHNAALVSPAAVLGNRFISGTLLILAGLYQWSARKRLCLTACATPLAFLQAHWHEGAPGALRMGVTHGAYCVGCCGLLMALLFVYGVMNLAWIFALTLFVTVERLVAPGPWFGQVSGVTLAALGLVTLLG